MDIVSTRRKQQRPALDLLRPCHDGHLSLTSLYRAGSLSNHGRTTENVLADGGGWGGADRDREEGSLHLTDCRDSAASLVFVSAPSGELPEDAVFVVPSAGSSGQAPAPRAAGVRAADGHSGGATVGAAKPSGQWDRTTPATVPADEAAVPAEPMNSSWPAPSVRSLQESGVRLPPAPAAEAANSDCDGDAEDYTVASTREWLRQLSGDVPEPPAESAREAAEQQAGGRPEQPSLWPGASAAGPAICNTQLAGTQRVHGDQVDAAYSLHCGIGKPAEAMLASWPAPADCARVMGMSRSLQEPDSESAINSFSEQDAAPRSAAAKSAPAGLAHGGEAVADDDAVAIVWDGCGRGSMGEAAGAAAAAARDLSADKVQGSTPAGAQRLASKARWHTLLPQSWLE